MTIASYNKNENLLKDSQEIAEGLSFQLDALKGTLNLLRWDIDDEAPDGKIQSQWIDLLSLLEIAIESMENNANKLTDNLIYVQKLKGNNHDGE